SSAMRKENVRTSYLLHLSTTADSKISDQPWVKFQSAGWVNIQSAPTARLTEKKNRRNDRAKFVSLRIAPLLLPTGGSPAELSENDS
ncbi:MAG: hypothetical protein NT083_09425, partial [Rhodocyclales bacterium]|nr:hypothetical protein [Rhodocyclales bacterium]